MEQIRGMGTAVCHGDYGNRHFLWAQLSVLLSFSTSQTRCRLFRAHVSTGCIWWRIVIKTFFFSLLFNMLCINSYLSALELNMIFLVCVFYTTVWKHMLDVANPSPGITNEVGVTVLHVKQMLIFNLICW